MPRKKRTSSPFELYDDDFDEDASSQSSRNGQPPVQRNAANARERMRMRVLSSAYGRLKTKLPNIPPDTKLSKLDTLRLATLYIKQLIATVETGGTNVTGDGLDATHFAAEQPGGVGSGGGTFSFHHNGQSMSWPFEFHHMQHTTTNRHLPFQQTRMDWSQTALAQDNYPAKLQRSEQPQMHTDYAHVNNEHQMHWYSDEMSQATLSGAASGCIFEPHSSTHPHHMHELQQHPHAL